jgi:transcriptional regulator with XRE-family HTH domain
MRDDESSNTQTDWKKWMRDFGRQERRVREFLGLSQEQLARLAGVSQGAVSRLEAGRGLATPMLVILKINLAVARALRALDPALLNEDLRRALDFEHLLSQPIAEVGPSPTSITSDPELEELVHLYRGLSDRQRQTFLSVVRATASALASGSAASHEKP